MICKCGHDYSQHDLEDNCWDIDPTVTNQFVDPRCMCMGFKLDNLKYLEQKYGESIK